MKFRIGILMLIIFAAVAATAQPAQPATSPAAPTAQKVTPKNPYDSRSAKLWAVEQENFQMKANAITTQYQSQMTDLRTKYDERNKEITDWKAQIRKDNNWDSSYDWNPETDQWTHTPKPEPKAEVKKETPAKK